MKRILWNVRMDLGFACVGYMEVHGKYIWSEVVRILYFKEQNLKYHLHVRGRLIGKYDYINDARVAALQII
jgi:hypothetical protein